MRFESASPGAVGGKAGKGLAFSRSRERTMNSVQRRISEAALRLFAQKGSPDVSVSELADAAGVARGTIYNNLESPERLFETVAAELADEMNDRVVATYEREPDPAVRLATGVRLYVRRAHEEPHWGRFLVHFGMSSASLRRVWTGSPLRDLMLGIEKGRYAVSEDRAQAALGLISGSTLSAILMVVEGVQTWRDAGSETAELILRALGVEPSEARAIASAPLPELATPA